MNLNVNYGLSVMTINVGSSCKKCTTLVWDVDSGEVCARVDSGGIWELCILSAQFCYETKTALKNKGVDELTQRRNP